jgi:hypothetical protein
VEDFEIGHCAQFEEAIFRNVSSLDEAEKFAVTEKYIYLWLEE